jgi:MFS transporter, ACS family, glucarate transporter
VRKRSGVLLLLVLLAVITFLDRLCIAVAGTRIQDDLGISPERWGWILGAFVLSYGIFEIPTGAHGDRFGQRRVLTRVVVWWSAFTALTGAAHHFWQLILTRFLFGAGEAGAYPNASGVIARWFPKSERARAQGFIWAASRAGGAISPIVVVPMMASFGWRRTFWVLGGIGLLWAVVWHRWFHDRCEEQPGIREEEVAEIRASAASSEGHAAVPWRRILTNRQTWIICTMYWCYAWGSWFYFSWFPIYLVRGVGFSVAEMGIFSSFPFLLGVLGNVTGGFASDRLVNRYGLRIGRKLLACTTLVLSSLLLLGMSMSRNKNVIVVLSTLGFGIMDLMLPAAWAVCLDVGRQYAGVVTGIMNTSGQFSGFVCTILFGYIVAATHSYNAPLWIISAMVLASAGLFAMIDPTQPLVAEYDQRVTESVITDRD